MLTNLFNLKSEELDKVESYLKIYPGLEKAYFLNQELYEFYRMKDYEHALEYIAKWSGEVLDSGITESHSVLKIHIYY